MFIMIFRFSMIVCVDYGWQKKGVVSFIGMNDFLLQIYVIQNVIYIYKQGKYFLLVKLYMVIKFRKKLLLNIVYV